MSVTAIVLITAKTDQINELAAALAEIPGVRGVFSVAGRVDLVAIVQAPRNEDLADIISTQIHKTPRRRPLWRRTSSRGLTNA